MTDQLPNWFLPDEADPSLLTPATWEEMADTSDQYLQVGVGGWASGWVGFHPR